MEKVYQELHFFKSEAMKLREECRTKTELSENLKKAHDEQLVKFQEVSLRMEKQAQELNEKTEEIYMVKQMYEEIKCSLNEKESIIKQLSSTNETLRTDCDEKSRKWEAENRKLALALEEANEKCRDEELKIRAFMEEIEGLKGLLSSISQKKCLEVEEKATTSKELKQKDDMVQKFEERNGKVEDELKWKKEQFKHLEEAHEMLQDQFRVSKKEWELEKSNLVDKIYSLQTSFDSQTRISQDLKSQLERCNLALAHEENRRKYFDVQLSESKACFENAFAECEEVKLKMDCLTLQKDNDIAALKYSLSTKENLFKEMEYQSRKLEQENQELRFSLKELQEAQIHQAGTSSFVGKPRNKLKSLERINRDCSANPKTKEAECSSQLKKMEADFNECRSELNCKDAAMKELMMELENLKLMHRDCSANLKAKEAQWSSQLAKMTGDLNRCKSELEIKDEIVKELKIELEGCHSSIMQLKVQSEETSLMLSVYKTGFTEAQSMLESEKAELDLIIKERDEKVYLLMKQLEVKNNALTKAQRDIEEYGKGESSLWRIDSFNYTEQQQQLIMQKELERHKEMLVQSSESQQQLKERALQTERDFKERLREACDALDMANYEFAEKTSEGNEIEFEMQMWKSTAERLKVELEGSQDMRKELEASLLSQVEVEEILKTEKDKLRHALEERDRSMVNLQQQVVSLKKRETETASFERMETLVAFQSEKASFLRTAEENEDILKDLQKEIEELEQRSLRRELESAILTQIDVERTFEKEQRIDGLLQRLKSLEQKFNSSLASFSSQLEEKEVHINLVHKAWEQIAAAEVLARLEVEEKKLMILELEDDIDNIQQKLELQETSLSQSERQALVIESELEAKQLELMKFSSQMETKLRTSDALVNDLKSEKRTLLEDILKLSSERKNVLGDFGGLYDRISELSSEDMQLMGTLGKILQPFSTISELDLKEDERYNYLKDNQNANLSPTRKKLEEAIAGERSPFRELNN